MSSSQNVVTKKNCKRQLELLFEANGEPWCPENHNCTEERHRQISNILHDFPHLASEKINVFWGPQVYPLTWLLCTKTSLAKDLELVKFMYELNPKALTFRKTIHWAWFHAGDDVAEFLAKTCPKALNQRLDHFEIEFKGLPIHVACEQALEKTIVAMTRLNPKTLSAKTHQKQNPLHIAAFYSVSAETIQILAEMYPQALTNTDFLDRTPIHNVMYSKSASSSKAIRVLAQMNPAALSSGNIVALYYALYNHRPESDIDVLTDMYKRQLLSNTAPFPLHVAAGSEGGVMPQNEIIIRLFTKLNPQALSLHDTRGNLPLHYATKVETGAKENVKILLELYPQAVFEKGDLTYPIFDLLTKCYNTEDFLDGARTIIKAMLKINAKKTLGLCGPKDESLLEALVAAPLSRYMHDMEHKKLLELLQIVLKAGYKVIETFTTRWGYLSCFEYILCHESCILEWLWHKNEKAIIVDLASRVRRWFCRDCGGWDIEFFCFFLNALCESKVFSEIHVKGLRGSLLANQAVCENLSGSFVKGLKRLSLLLSPANSRACWPGLIQLVQQSTALEELDLLGRCCLPSWGSLEELFQSSKTLKKVTWDRVNLPPETPPSPPASINESIATGYNLNFCSITVIHICCNCEDTSKFSYLLAIMGQLRYLKRITIECPASQVHNVLQDIVRQLEAGNNTWTYADLSDKMLSDSLYPQLRHYLNLNLAGRKEVTTDLTMSGLVDLLFGVTASHEGVKMGSTEASKGKDKASYNGESIEDNISSDGESDDDDDDSSVDESDDDDDDNSTENTNWRNKRIPRNINHVLDMYYGLLRACPALWSGPTGDITNVSRKRKCDQCS